jgi:ubiquinone/menaquinone biosynthesis C-methylase UbiE
MSKLKIFRRESNSNFLDQQKEKERYSNIARKELKIIESGEKTIAGLDAIPDLHRRPYVEYYRVIQEKISPQLRVLELACGSGMHTQVILDSGAETWVLDISEEALKVLGKRTVGNINLVCASMDSTPFCDNTFDLILSCGGLSYADNDKLLKEIVRILKPGAGLIVLDSLNHNLVYKLNRFIHFLKGNRSYSTLTRMPTMKYVASISSHFSSSSFKTFDSNLWLKVILRKIGFSEDSEFFQNLSKDKVSKQGFKFLLVCESAIK